MWQSVIKEVVRFRAEFYQVLNQFGPMQTRPPGKAETTTNRFPAGILRPAETVF